MAGDSPRSPTQARLRLCVLSRRTCTPRQSIDHVRRLPEPSRQRRERPAEFGQIPHCRTRHIAADGSRAQNRRMEGVGLPEKLDVINGTDSLRPRSTAQLVGNLGSSTPARLLARSSADPVKALGGGGLLTLSGGVGRELDDEVGVEGCADSFQQRDRGDDAAGFQA